MESESETNGAMELPHDAARFLPLVRSIAAQTHRELVPEMDQNRLVDLGFKGLLEGFAQFKSRQGLTLRAYLVYRIGGAIYAGLSGLDWPTEEIRTRYLFLKKTNELLLNFHLSAEGTVKRSIQAEEEEILQLLRMMAIITLLAGRNLRVQELEPRQRDFISYYYDQDLALSEVSQKMGLSQSATFRLHLETVETLAKAKEQTPPVSTLDQGLQEVARNAKAAGLKGEALAAKVVETVLTQMFGKDFLSTPDAAALRDTITPFVLQDEHLSSKISSLISHLGNKSGNH